MTAPDVITSAQQEVPMTARKPDWRGVFPAATTQFAEDGSVDLAATAQLIEAMVDAGVHGIIALGSVGENTVLEPSEKLAVIRAAKEAARGRVPVLSGVAETATRAACRYAALCEEAGLDGLMLLPAMIYKADGREAVAHFRTVARATSLPIMIYNNPPAYHVDLKPEHLAALADVDNLVCVKESSNDPRRITDIKNRLGDRFILFCGVDDLILEAMALGAVGWVAGFADAFPRESVRLWQLLAEGRFAEALPLYRWFTPVLHLDDHAKLVQYIKLAATMTGHGNERVRPPRLPLDGEEREHISGIIRRAIETRPHF
jgi:4-hydroxy-tetrahydrodipicolinate synthase